ncbi:hypothetical protein Trydic_g16316 [Trypoxylus dichotomus]
MFKYILSIMICFDFMLALDKHDPEVYESIEEPLSEIVRKTRQYGEKYKPPVFIYDKTTQPDLRKWRYFQQQQIDSKNLEKVFSGSPSAYAPSKPRDKDQTVSETQESSLSLALKPRWKIIHPKFVTEKDNDFSPRELVKMQEQYGRRQSRRMSSLRTNNGNDRNVDNNSAKRNESKPVYMVKEFDLETDASEISEVQSPLDKRDQLSFILPNTFEDNSQTVRMPTFISEPIAKATSQSNLDNLKHNQNDMDALNSLLGNTHVAQIHGFKQLLHSQPMQVASLSNGHTGHMPLVNQQYFDAELIPQPVIIPANNNDHIPLHQIQNILQTGGQTLEQIQLQLDDLSRKEGEKAIAEAQQKAIEYVKSQQAAIAQAEIEGEQIAIAAIKAHNLQLPEALPKSLPLIQSQSSLQDTSTESGKSQQSSENSIPEHDEEQKLLAADSNLQTQTYLVSHQNTLSNQEVGNSLGDQVKNNYILSYPEMNHNGLSGVNNAHALNKNVEHVQQQVEAYETSSSKAHLQPLDIVQNGQSNSKNIQVSFQHEHNDEYAPNYSFGYQVVDYNSGVNYGHEETRDGKVTKGRYHVFLPDGRVQSVNYWVDLSGYHAKVTYSDVAHH